MATPREIKQRIASIRNTQKITKAMEMVSSVKLRKARAQILSARPYAEKLSEIASNLRSSYVHSMSPLLSARPIKKIGLVVVSSDKGLCGGFNSNVAKKALEFIRSHGETQVLLTVIGKKAGETLKRRSLAIRDKYHNVFFKPNYAEVSQIGGKVLADFLSGEFDEVHIVYNEFKSSVSQKPKIEQLLPVPEIKAENNPKSTNYIFEPDGKACINDLLSKYFFFQIWRIILESYAGEHGARMAAMGGATKNAGELIGKLTLFYNKARQASITKELLEVVSGAESLR